MYCLIRYKTSMLFVVLVLFSASVTFAAEENVTMSLDELVVAAPRAEIRDVFNDFMPTPSSKIKIDRYEIDTITKFQQKIRFDMRLIWKSGGDTLVTPMELFP